MEALGTAPRSTEGSQRSSHPVSKLFFAPEGSTLSLNGVNEIASPQCANKPFRPFGIVFDLGAPKSLNRLKELPRNHFDPTLGGILRGPRSVGDSKAYLATFKETFNKAFLKVFCNRRNLFTIFVL